MARKGSRSSFRSSRRRSQKPRTLPESADTMAASPTSPSTVSADTVAGSSGSLTACAGPRTAELHELARSVYCRLSAHPALAVEQLTVRCSTDAVYLSGSVQLRDDTVDLRELAREISGVDEVISQVIVRRHIPPKG